MEYYDIAIIGAGPGGYVAAITAAGLGKKTLLIEQDQLGGTCLNVGCIPTKTLLASAGLFEKLKKAASIGIKAENISIDFQKIQKRKNDVIANLRKGLETLIKTNQITICKGVAEFASSSILKIKTSSGQKEIEATKIIIATGSLPSELKNLAVDGQFIHNSTTILNLKTIPKSLTIIGGGYIGCEFASFFNTVGTKVHIVETANKILNGQDDSIADFLSKHFHSSGINLLTSTKATSIETKNDKVQIILDNGQIIESDICLLSVGRTINTEALHLKNIDIQTAANGAILTNEQMQTNIPHIYAIGDVLGKAMLAHSASHEGIIAAKNASGQEAFMRYDAIPSVIFTSPEAASVGLTEKAAKEQNINVEIAIFPLSYLGKAQASAETAGFVKLIADKETNQIIGAHMVGESASTMIEEMTLAINNELTVECVIDTVHAHPTLSEEWFEAELLLNGTPLNHPPKKSR